METLKGDTGATGNGIASIEQIVQADKTIYKVTYTNGEFEEFTVETAYTINYEYGVASSYFSSAPATASIKPSQWLTTLPEIDSNKEYFLGWFIAGTDKQVANYDFIGGNVTLVARFNMPGLYNTNGALTQTWANLTTDGTITVSKNEITACTTDISGNLLIDDSITAIGENAFKDCTNLEGVTIPASVTSLGAHAFNNTGLTTIYIPASVTAIGGSVFAMCTLTSIKVDDGNTNYYVDNGMLIQRIGTGHIVLAATAGITAAQVPTTVTVIAGYAFYGCLALKEVILPEGLTTIREYAFFTTGLTSITIPAGVTSIGEAVFGGCSSLANIVVAEDNSVYKTVFNKVLYSNSTVLASTYDVNAFTTPGTVKNIGAYAFYNRNQLTTLTINPAVTGIGDYAFYSCSTLSTVTFVEGSTLEVIGNYAFSLCELTSITIPSSVTELGDGVFQKCSLLTEVIIAEDSALEKIGSYAFVYCINLTSITIPASVTYIGSRAFGNCYSLAEAVFIDKTNWHVVKGDSATYIKEEYLDNSSHSSTIVEYLTSKYATYTWHKNYASGASLD